MGDGECTHRPLAASFVSSRITRISRSSSNSFRDLMRMSRPLLVITDVLYDQPPIP